MTPQEERDSELVDRYREWWSEDLRRRGCFLSRAATKRLGETGRSHSPDTITKHLNQTQEDRLEIPTVDPRRRAETQMIDVQNRIAPDNLGRDFQAWQNREWLRNIAKSNPEIFIVIANACVDWSPTPSEMERLDIPVGRFIDSKLKQLNEPIAGMSLGTAGLGNEIYSLARTYVSLLDKNQRRVLASKITKAVKAAGKDGSIREGLAKVGLIVPASRH